jgi:hypothetical protein
MDTHRRAHCMASTLHAGFSTSGFLPVRTSKTLVYAAPVDNEEVLQHRIVDACQTIRNCPSIFERMRRSVMRCPMQDNLRSSYKITFSAITHKLNVS